MKAAVLGLVRDVLKMPDMSLSDSLVACGANSMTAMLLVPRAKAETKVEVEADVEPKVRRTLRLVKG